MKQLLKAVCIFRKSILLFLLFLLAEPTTSITVSVM